VADRVPAVVVFMPQPCRRRSSPSIGITPDSHPGLSPERIRVSTAIVRRPGRNGLAVTVNGRRGDEQAHEAARGIRDDGGVAEAFGADVTDEQLVVAVTSRLGPVDLPQ
jgi:hypothetical protein